MECNSANSINSIVFSALRTDPGIMALVGEQSSAETLGRAIRKYAFRQPACYATTCNRLILLILDAVDWDWVAAQLILESQSPIESSTILTGSLACV